MRGAALRCRRNRKLLANLLELRCTAIEVKDPAAALSHDQDPKLPFGFAYGG